MVHPRALSPVLIGREKELQELGERLSQAEKGRGGLVLIAGVAGVGKSRLLAEFLSGVREAGRAEVLEGHCHDSDAVVPFGPVVEALRTWLGLRSPQALLAAAGPWKVELCRLLPELGGAPADKPLPEADAKTLARRQFEMVRHVLQPGATEATRLFVLEDLHWSDLTSLELLAYLSRTTGEDRIMLLGTYRDDEIHPRHPLTHWLAELEREGTATTWTLGHLARDELRDMVRLILGEEIPLSSADRLYDRTGGNPFFLEEILKSLRDAHKVDALLAPGEQDLLLRRVRMPLSVKDSVLTRTADLDEATVRVLTYAAVIGQEFDFELLQALTEQTESDLLRSVSALVDRQLVSEETFNGQDRFAFRHALTREVIYQNLLGRERRGLHLKVLHAIETVRPDQLEVSIDGLARHSFEAGELEKAARYAMLAGERAERMRAFQEARHHYELVLELMGPGVSEERASLLDRLGNVGWPLGDGQLTMRYWKQASALFLEKGDSLRVASIEQKLSLVAWEGGDTQTAFAHARTALEILEGDPPTRELAMAYSTLSQRFMVSGVAGEAIAWGNKALEIAEIVGDQRTKAHAMNNMGVVFANYLGRVEEGLRLLEESLRIADASGFNYDTERACLNLSNALTVNGDTTRAIEILQKGLEVAESAGDTSFIASLTANLAGVNLVMANWAIAEEQLTRSRRAAPDFVPNRLDSIMIQTIILMDRGKPQAALDELRGAEALFERIEENHAEFHARVAECLYRLGRRSEGIEALDQACQTWSKRGPNIGTIGEMERALWVYLELGESRKAEAVLAAVEEAIQEVSNVWTRAVRNSCLGLIAKDRGEFSDAIAHFSSSIGEWSPLQWTYVEAWVRRNRAECLLRSSDPANITLASDDLKQARQVFERTGSVYALEGLSKLEDLLSAGGPMQAETRGPLGSLTPREREVLALLARGLSNREIAKELVISAKTAEIHVGNILGKLGLKSRAQAAALATRQSPDDLAVPTNTSA